MIYFFTWLVVLIIMVNPPIYDDEKPKISLTVLPDMQEFGGDVLIVAKITDNFGVKKKDITFILEDEKVSQNDFEFIENQVFKYVHKSPSNSTVDKKYKFTLIVKDKSGLTSQKSGTFEYSNDTITLSSKEHISVNNGDTINFNVRAKNIDRVYYTINNNKTKIDMYYNQNSGFYETYPKYWAGIKENENVTLNVYAVCYQYFKQATNEQNSDKWKLEDLKWYNSFNNTIVDSSEYNFTADDDMIGDTPPTFTQISPKEVFDKVPGFEILAFILSLAVLVLIFKYRKKHRRN